MAAMARMGSDLDVENRCCGAGSGGVRTSGQTRGYRCCQQVRAGSVGGSRIWGLGVGNSELRYRGELREAAALVDFADFGVAVELFYGIVFDEPGAAEDFYGK